MLELAFPPACPQQFQANLVKRGWENGPQELMRRLPNRFLRPPSVSLLRSAIPVGDHVVHIANEYRVMRLVEEAGLLLQCLRGLLGLHGENGCQKDRSKTDKRVDNPFEWPTGRRREQITHHRQAQTAGCDQHDAPRAQKASRHQDNHDVQNRVRYVDISHRVSNKDGNRDDGGRDGENESGRVASGGCGSHRLSPWSVSPESTDLMPTLR
jgi:hypothetical protein